jgi:lipopolysaccharide/colanic/teichoic acid biosynthesis glycosyltransferase
MKRLVDIVVSLLGLVVAAPVMAGVALAVAASMGRPVLFRQVRPGRDEAPFTLLKFRTMTGADALRRADAERLTRLGRWLRRTSLDELPSLVNVLRGDMSLVGPRPLLTRYLPYYTDRERSRHAVRPGLTGWAQIHGRNLVGWDERLALDAWYVEHRSMRLDLLILARTAGTVLFGRGVVEAPTTVMPDLDEARSTRCPRSDAAGLSPSSSLSGRNQP